MVKPETRVAGSKRERALQTIVNAGYHDDGAWAVRAACDGKVARLAMMDAFNKGKRAKVAGVKCPCDICAQGCG